MHAASAEKSERLKRTLAALRAGGLFGRTGAELSRATGSLAISTDISELRKNGWIVDSQHLKPSNRMPSFTVFEGEELRAVAAWLESLK